MSSLSVHLRQAEDHSGLPFHPNCPVCRSARLAGSLGGDELVSRGTQAAIAAGLVAFSGLGTPVAVAAGPDQDIEGTAEVVESRDPSSLDVGDPTTSLPDAAALVPDDEAPAPSETDEVDAALAPEPVDAVAEPVVEASGEADAPEDDPSAASEPVALAEPPTDVPTATSPPEEPVAQQLHVDSSNGSKREERAERSKQTAPAATHRVVVAPAPAPAPPAPAAPMTIRVVAGASTDTGRAAPGDRFHTVQRGESLWSIASDMLGGDASVARVAREVNRLWELNADRIATGSPDLLFAGTRLRLR